ncbi:MAG: glutamate 5-kinase [Deltaproteobacteria bacterium]|nr:glutamate 5-kinase [Deltaproteobacteria bacterium]MBW1954106.1 glutamate 5-kinase [Deltaproteobacteria bacterium]MBW2040996.1 glutamate 5-kinase [Deltaproteobacteria bacterium]MBW2131301.1 glutamate 5-kinase [Deltaproteobacteria bacterium]
MDRASYFSNSRRIVVKVGSSVLTGNEGLNLKAVRSISRQVSRIIDQNREVLLVSSGAQAAGTRKIGLSRRPDELPKRQAVAAVGQAGLIMEYEKAFARYHKKVAQILLTNDGLSHRKRYLNARNTLYALLSWGVVPVINENDTVSVMEIQFGDNDNLAALITLMMDAHLLIALSDIDGLYTKNPAAHADAALIPVVTQITKEVEAMAGNLPGSLGTGGMVSKIEAARKLASAGIPMVIANGNRPNILLDLMSGKALGTFFVPKKSRLSGRKSWIAFNLKPKGVIRIDSGAAKAVCKGGKSLLPSGVIGVEGEFQVGAPVAFSSNNRILGTGLVNYSAADIRKIMGLKTSRIKERLGYKPYDEVIHRDNLVLTADASAEE